MTTLIIIGENKKHIAKTISRFLSRYTGVLFISGEQIKRSYTQVPQFLVYVPTLGTIPACKNAFVLDYHCDIANLKCPDGNSIQIGLSTCCDVAASSIREQSFCFSLQHPIQMPGGKSLFPFECPIKYKKTPHIQPLLCACAVLLLTGNLPIPKKDILL